VSAHVKACQVKETVGNGLLVATPAREKETDLEVSGRAQILEKKRSRAVVGGGGRGTYRETSTKHPQKVLQSMMESSH